MVPRALRIVAVLFLLFGINAMIGIFYKAVALNRAHLDLGVLGIPVYYGLLRFSDGWRKAALFLLWLSFLSTLVLFALGVFASSPAKLSLPGVLERDVPTVWMAIFAVPMFLLTLWQYRVLTRPAIKSLFTPGPAHAGLSGATSAP